MRKSLKTLIVFLIIITMAFSWATFVLADTDAAGDPIYIPLRKIFEYAGSLVTWDEENRQIIVEHEDDTYIFFLMSNEAFKNEEAYELNFIIYVEDGRSYISYFDASFIFDDGTSHLSGTIMTAVLASLQLMDLASISGITVAVIDARAGYTWTHGFGYADVAKAIPVNDQTLFNLASISKTFTAVATMHLVEKGLLDLEKPVVTYLPDFSTLPDMAGNGNYEKITVRMLLSHASGLSPDIIASGVATSNGYLSDYMDGFLDTLEGMNMLSPEASVFTYANNAFTLLGVLVAELSGYDSYFDGFVDYTRKNIFDPAGMALTTFELGEAHKPYLAQPHKDATTGDTFLYYNALPAGGIYSNARDMARFMHMLLSGGTYDGTRILSEDSVKKMFEIQDYDFEEAPNFFVPHMRPGLGLLHSTGMDGFTHVGHGGNLIHYHSDMAFDPDSGIGVFVSTNSITGAGIERILSSAILQTAVYEKTGTLKVPEPDYSVVPIELTPEELKDYEGIYVMAGAGEFVQLIVAQDEVLYMLNLSGFPFPLSLIPLSDGSFINPDLGLRLWFEDMFGELVMFMGEVKGYMIGGRLDVETYQAVESIEILVGVYEAVLDEGYVSIAGYVEIGVDENGISYLRLYALHGQTPISPIIYIDDLTYSGGVPIEFLIDGDDIFVTFSGGTFKKIS